MDTVINFFAWMTTLNKWELTMVTVAGFISFGSLCFFVCVFYAGLLRGGYAGDSTDEKEDVK